MDNAGDIVISKDLENKEIIENQNYQGLIEFELPQLARHGITSICEGWTYWKRNYHKIWQHLHYEGQLTVRTILGLWAYP